MADSKAFVVKHGLAVNTPSTIVFGTNAKLHANNTITAGTITSAMLATGAAGTDDSTVLATNTALRALITAEANRNTLVNTNLTSTNTALRSLISAENTRVTLVNTNLTATNTALRTLVSDRLQVANAATLYLKQTGSAGDEKSVAGQVTFSHNVIVSGNLTVSGTTTSVNSNEVSIGDNKIVLNSDETGTPSADAGIEVERGTSTNSRLEWIESSDKWQAFDGSAGYDLLLNDGTFAANSALNTQTTRINLVNTNLTSTNTAIRALVTTEANRNTLVNTNLTSTNTALRSLITAEANRNTLVNTNLTSTNTAIRALITAADLTGVKADTLLVKNPASQHTYTVTVISKTSAHPYSGGSSSAYALDGKEAPSLLLLPNMTYRFDQSDNSNSSHPLRFYLEADKTTAYTTNVTTNGTPGSSGAYTQIVVTDATPPVLYYQCSSHAYMGSVASSATEGTTDHYTEGSTNLYYTNARADARIAAANISALNNVHTASPSDGQALVWDNSNSYWAPGTVGGSITVQEEGSSLSTAASILNFVGSAVTATGSGSTKTITISAGGSLTVQDEGSALSTAATTLNFVGSGVTASGTGATKTITISGGGGGSSGVTVQEEGSSLSTTGTTLNFVGAGVTASGTGATKTITIPTVGGIGANGTFGGDFTTGTGNGSTTTFTSPISTNLANNIIVSVDGLMQRPTTDYTVSGTTVTFGTAPPASTTVMVRSFAGGLTNKAGINVQTFTGNGSNTVYKLADPVQSLNDVIVTVNGVVQRPTTDYTYSNPNITFDTALATGDVIAFRSFNIASSGGITYQAVSSNITLAKGNGYMVDCSSARTLTLPTSAAIGDEIRIIDATGESNTNNITVARNGHKIQSAASDLTISTNRAAIGLVYFNVAQGWLLTEKAN